MVKENIYFEGLGYRNPISEFQQISWFLEQKTKTMNKTIYSKFWISTRKSLFDQLLSLEAYELLGFIRSKICDAKYQKSLLNREKSKQFRENQEKIILQNLHNKIHIHSLINQICYN